MRFPCVVFAHNILILLAASACGEALTFQDIHLCSDDFCEHFKCVYPQGYALQCPEGEVLEKKGSICGCCDTCVRIIKEGDVCENIAAPPGGKPVASCSKFHECAHAKDSNGELVGPKICIPLEDTGGTSSNCIRNIVKRKNAINDGVDNAPNVRVDKDLWMPNCEDSSEHAYKIKQCNSAKCFCVSPDGARLFGQSEEVYAKNMSCLCSLRLHEKEKREGQRWLTNRREHCTPSGDFAKLQCVDDVCYCVDEQTGESRSRVVKEHLKAFLPCYELDDFEEDSYLSSCEKQVQRERSLKYTFFKKGIAIEWTESISCAYDGTFGFRQCTAQSQVCRCTDKKGVSIGAFSVAESTGRKADMNCRCARDQLENSLFGSHYPTMICAETGNFNNYQDIGGKGYCVDGDGDRVSTEVTKEDSEIDNTRVAVEDYCRFFVSVVT